MHPPHPPAAPDRALLAALAQMDEGVIVVGARGTIVFVNHVAARMHDVRIGAVLTLRDGSGRAQAARLEQERNALARQLQGAFAQSPSSTVVHAGAG